MKKIEKILQYPEKIEAAHTLRKDKELDDIKQFDAQAESYKCRELDQLLKVDHAYNQRLEPKLEEPFVLELELIHSKTQALLEIEDFEHQTMDTQLTAPGNEFEIIAEMQEVTYDEAPHPLKQLPAGSPDAFTHELSEFTEDRLQRENEKNDATINSGQEQEPEEETKEPETVFFFHSPISKKK